MAYNDWDEVIETYQHLLETRYVDQGEGMLKLVPRLKEELTDIAFDFGTSHFAFFIKLSGVGKQVNIVYKGDDLYKIYYFQRNLNDNEEVNVSGDNVIDVIRDYIDKLRNQSN